MRGWQNIYSTDQSYRADIVKAVLEDHGMSPVIITKKDSSYNNFGSHEVHVSTKDVLEALKIIEDDIDFK